MDDAKRKPLPGSISLFSAAFFIYLSAAANILNMTYPLFIALLTWTLLIFIFFPEKIHIPNKTELYYLLLCGGFSVAGQFLLTYGFRFVTAVEGSIISSSRILMAALLGPVLAYEEMMGIYGWIGALLIFTANVFLAVRKAAHSEE